MSAIKQDGAFAAAVRAEVVAQLKVHAATSEKAMLETLAPMLPTNSKALEFVMTALKLGNATMIASAERLPLQTVQQ